MAIGKWLLKSQRQRCNWGNSSSSPPSAPALESQVSLFCWVNRETYWKIPLSSGVWNPGHSGWVGSVLTNQHQGYKMEKKHGRFYKDPSQTVADVARMVAREVTKVYLTRGQRALNINKQCRRIVSAGAWRLPSTYSECRCMVGAGAWRVQVHDKCQWIVNAGTWWVEMCGACRCIVSTGAWCLQVHGEYRCMLSTRAWWVHFWPAYMGHPRVDKRSL